MFSSLSLMIGLRFSRSRKQNKLVSFISISSMLGIAFGVSVIIIGLSAMNGFEQELRHRVLSVIPHGEFESVNGPTKRWQALERQILKDPEVVAAAPYVRFTALAERGTQLKAIEVRGVDPNKNAAVSQMSNFITHDAWQTLTPGQQQVILGKGVADKLNVTVGDAITLVIPQEGSGQEQRMQAPKRVRVKVVGLLVLNGQIDHNLAILPLADAQRYTNYGDAVSGIEVKLSDVYDAERIMLDVGHQVDQFVYLKSWQQKFGYLYHDIRMVRVILYLVMVLVIGVACFNIVSTLMMAVKDRASEIAILRTMGASDKLIQAIFMWQGVISGVFGALCGTLFGLLVALNLTSLIKGLEFLVGHPFLSGDIYFVDFLPSVVSATDVMVVASTSIVLSFIATLYPARRASRMQPATILSAK